MYSHYRFFQNYSKLCSDVLVAHSKDFPCWHPVILVMARQALQAPTESSAELTAELTVYPEAIFLHTEQLTVQLHVYWSKQFSVGEVCS